VRRGPDVQQVLLEALFERVRERVAPDRPSRLACAFAWLNIEWARWFRDTYILDGHLYRCSWQDGTILVRDAAWLIDNDLSGPTDEVVRRIEPRAEQYWLGDDPAQIPEVLIHGTAVVDEAIVDYMS
jgi:hypothetical protein